MKKETKKEEIIEKKIVLKPMNWKKIQVPVREKKREGHQPCGLLMERNDGYAAEYYDKKKGKKVVKKDTRLEEEKVEGKIHHTLDGKVGFPSSGFSKGMRIVAYHEDKDMGRLVKEGVRFLDTMVPIKYDEMTVARHDGKNSGLTRSPRLILRPEFHNWSCVLDIEYNADIISPEQLINLINTTGVVKGIGGYNPAHNGNYGQYEVVTDEKR